ncbi:putative RNA recognition motif domain, nucleotide-binding alpha-beta plait domain superfamily [Helianthus annuus]|nr:putative RNA recognition motif domain, nucleotide-binding alpha-beta plait domain superfamily [Helianthus annuus]
MSREFRLRHATTFFISNLPDGCTRDRLWEAFGFLDNLEDVFVPRKKDKAGNTFGFVKLSNVRDVASCMNSLKEVSISGAIIGVNLAKFNRDGTKKEMQNSGERVSVFSRLNFGVPDRRPMSNVQGRKTGNLDGRSYSDVVSNQNCNTQVNKVELPPLNTETKKRWEFRSLVGEVKDIEILNDHKTHLDGLVDEGPILRYLGGLKVLVTFSNVEEADDFLRNRGEEWATWFSRLYVWDGSPPLFERVAWIKVIGVPAPLWDRHVLDRIGQRCGRLLVRSEASFDDSNMAEDRMAILVQSGNRISMEMNITWKEHLFTVWVEEISGQWGPAFLSGGLVEDSDLAGSSPDVEYSFEFRGRNSKGCTSDLEQSCMGINSVASSSKDAAHGLESDTPRVSRKAAVSGQKEREDVGLGDNVFNTPNAGPHLDANRPGYITTRPKSVKVHRKEAQNSLYPI